MFNRHLFQKALENVIETKTFVILETNNDNNDTDADTITDDDNKITITNDDNDNDDDGFDVDNNYICKNIIQFEIESLHSLFRNLHLQYVKKVSYW